VQAPGLNTNERRTKLAILVSMFPALSCYGWAGNSQLCQSEGECIISFRLMPTGLYSVLSLLRTTEYTISYISLFLSAQESDARGADGLMTHEDLVVTGAASAALSYLYLCLRRMAQSAPWSVRVRIGTYTFSISLARQR
jgi:hypothetical protein